MKAWRRFKDHRPPFVGVERLHRAHPAALGGRTLYLKRVQAPTSASRLFKEGGNNRKIGRTVVKGKWKGMPIYTLTLEERATCPKTCRRWLDCFGNKMNWSVRWRHGAELEAEIEREVADICRRHGTDPFVVRLHVLGDFYSTAYVRMWARLLRRHAQLHVFGYTARDPWRDKIGVAIDALSASMWDRFAVRFSGQPLAERAAITLETPDAPVPADAVVCPAQTEKTECCGTCGLCWQTRRNIAFLLH